MVVPFLISCEGLIAVRNLRPQQYCYRKCQATVAVLRPSPQKRHATFLLSRRDSLILLDEQNGSELAKQEAILNFGPSTASAGSNPWWSSGPALGNSWSAGFVFSS